MERGEREKRKEERMSIKPREQTEICIARRRRKKEEEEGERKGLLIVFPCICTHATLCAARTKKPPLFLVFSSPSLFESKFIIILLLWYRENSVKKERALVLEGVIIIIKEWKEYFE